jgi:hypothetical protein
MAKSIPIFEVVDVAPATSGRPIHTRGSAARVVKAVDHSVEQLEQHMTNFVEGVQQMLSKGAQVVGEFRMETVEVQAEIGIEGQVGFLGTGLSASGSSQIKIVFERVN